MITARLWQQFYASPKVFVAAIEDAIEAAAKR
jgi:hypothetical protein